VIALILSAALLAGIGSSQRMGEVSPFTVVTAQAGYRAISGEILWDSADKVENRSGWSLRGAGDARLSFLTVGGAYTYRHTDGWSKDAWWLRTGAVIGPVWLIASVALGSPNEEKKLEARLRLRHKWIAVEPRLWIGKHSTSDQLGGPSYGADILMGVTR
jgi:hypothetical protein